MGNPVGYREGRSRGLVGGNAVGFEGELWQMLRLHESSSLEYGGVPIAVLALAISVVVSGV